MFIEKRKRKEGIKYYLAHTFREGNKIHKIRKLLGTNLSPEVIKERKEKAEKLILDEINKYKIIRDPLHDKITKEEVEFIRQLETEANLKIIHLSPKQWKDFSQSFSYNTNAIEGSELDLKETKKIIEKGEWPIESSKQDVAEAIGVNEAVEYIRKTPVHISLDLIKEIHHIVFRNSKSFAGEVRKKGQEVIIRNGVGEIMHEGAPSERIPALLKELAEWYNIYKNKYPAILLASVVHNQFENIHPFGDGNGRVGRILMNNILLKHKLPPLNINIKNQQEYYQAIGAYDRKGDIRPTIELMLKEYKNLKKIIKK